ncbi:hypothetical protein BDV93DRAFT_456513 [Ceratobasidium sp. AG-I]|nr:hypothetical protein BDV93DRAFT_456513 [Ceratobasidium sp. AG-I]
MELFAEVKKTADQDPFRDGSPEIIDFNLDAPYDDLPKATKRKIDILGQSVCYATTILAQQHRQFAYSMMISGTMVRFLRWDRAGAIVSQAFDCRKEPDVLCQFMWRLEHLSMAQRGFDTTVVQGSTEDYGSIFSDAIKNRVCFELDIPHQGAKADKALKQHYDPDQLSIVTVSEGSINKTYCICRPLEAPLSVVGRATRGYWSVDVTTGEVRFLKDTWRKDLAGLEYEGNVVRELSKQGVQNVPKLDCHGDVISVDGKVQDTKTQDYIGARWVRRSLSQEQLKQHIVKHTHYRMVSETVGCSLHEHQNLGELMSAASDVYQCILDANQLCQRLHRDISANNIILVRDPATGVRNGVAIDWELSIKTARPKVANYTISGTWQFISYRLLQRTDTTPHRIVDDLESLFWVVCWFLLLYYADFSVKILASRLSGIFDHFRYEAGHFVGGEGKVNILVDQTSVVSGFQDPIVVEWITKYAKFLFNAIMAPKDRVPDTMGLESVFCLVGKMPQGVLKQVPDWKELKTYRPLGAHQLLPPTISWSSVAAMSESGMAIQPSQTTGSEAPAHIPEENAGEEEGEAGEGAK